MKLRIAVALCFTLLLCGCNTTRGVGYVNPDAGDVKIRHIGIYVQNLSEFGVELENKIVSAFSARNIKATPFSTIARFSKTQEEFVEKGWSTGVDAVLVLSYSDSSSSSTVGYQMYGGSHTTGSVNVTGYNSANYSANTYSNSTAVPMVSFFRAMSSESQIILPSGEILWAGSTKREAQGLAFIGDNLTLNKTAEALMSALEEDDMVPTVTAR